MKGEMKRERNGRDAILNWEREDGKRNPGNRYRESLEQDLPGLPDLRDRRDAVTHSREGWVTTFKILKCGTTG